MSLRCLLGYPADVQADVRDFHRALDIPSGDTPAIRRPELRAALIEEEAAETCSAIRRGDLIEAIDGMCDVLCVVYGAAVEFGIDLAPFWDEVHRTNMAKVGGAVREDGKRLKPPGWTPPDIAGVLARASRRPNSALVCDACGKSSRSVKARGWFDEGSPMRTCGNCGGPPVVEGGDANE